MKALVTGGAGFVGTNLIKRLLNDSYDVISIDNYCSGFKKNHQKGCEYYNTNLINKTFYDDCKIGDIDIIFHMAALARIQPSIKNPVETIENNFNSTLNVLEYARNNNVSVVYAGSSSKHHGLYGSPYAWSKYGGEELCKLYNEVYNLNTAVCRFYNVYGDNHIRTGTYATVIGIFENQFLKKEALTLVGDGEQRRDFTHVDDIVDGLIKCGDNLLFRDNSMISGDFFELGSGVNYSINEVAKMFGKEYPVEYVSERKGEYDRTLCDYSEARLKLNWKPTNSLKNYIKEFINK
tara:strand:+ start:5727 stop:6605 length:879 start_codon:yes stop_codon:yes gene_type:complete